MYIFYFALFYFIDEIMEEAYNDIGPEILIDIYNNGNDQQRINLLKFLNSKNILTCIYFHIYILF